MRPQYTCEVTNRELRKRQVFTGTDQKALEGKANALGRTWSAEAALEQLHNILNAALREKSAVDWERLKHKNPYPKPRPEEFLLSEPQLEDTKYQPALTFLDRLVKSRAERKKQAAHALYVQDHADWENAKQQNAAAIEEWNAAAGKFRQDQEYENAAISKHKLDYESLQPDAITNYSGLVLSASEYPDAFPKDFDLEYVSGTKILIVDFSLPAPEHLPRIKEVKYVKTKDELVEVLLPENESNRLYDDVLYQICLRTLHELFDADVIGALNAIVFNGWVKSIDKATGKEVNGCVISVHAKKEEFQNINLGNVDAKACFKALKGVGSSKLHSLTPVAPVLKINREDKRFIASKEVAGQLDERFNLAAMDWEDFEHLIRGLFEQEFKQSGGEVKITQASRDGGVDAVAFDPDVIRGGKTVIQAKRYTNTVSVSAVRDLYGTVLNEGASKGILVTTSDYGPDAYEFAKGKPLVLLNGANLLNLLEKHGHKAKIDLKEAKMILGEKMPS